MVLINVEGMEVRVKAYLSDVAAKRRGIQCARDRLKEQLEKADMMRAIAYGDTTTGGSPKDVIAEAIQQIADLTDELAREVVMHERDVHECERLCSRSLSENRHALWLHYVEGEPWASVAKALLVSEPTVYRMRVDGISELYPIMPSVWRRPYEYDSE